MFRIFFSKPRAVNEIMWINMLTPDNTIWNMHIRAGKLRLKIHTQNI